jgi:hypothetical protein
MADSIRSSLNLKIRDPFKARIAPPHSSMVAHPAVTIAQQLYEGGRATGELYGQQPLLSLPEPYCISQCQRSADCRQRAESCKTASHGNTSYRENRFRTSIMREWPFRSVRWPKGGRWSSQSESLAGESSSPTPCCATRACTPHRVLENP